MHVAYASRQVAYPPPIFEMSVNTAVARAVPARDCALRETFVALRAFDAFAVATALRAAFAGTAERTVVVAARLTFGADWVRTALRAPTDDGAVTTLPEPLRVKPRPTK